MGCACSCRRHEASEFPLSSWKCYYRRCCFCGMMVELHKRDRRLFFVWLQCSVVHPFSGKRETTSSHRSTSVPQSTGLLDITSGSVLFPEISRAPAGIQHEDTSPCINIASVEVESQSFGSLREAGEAGLAGPEQIEEQDLQKQKEAFPVSKAKSRGFGSIESILILPEDEDSCPICLEEYDKDNPQIDTVCEHHYHLGCILEWMERSDNCPMCDQEILFNECL